jgi:hypothetical protein
MDFGDDDLNIGGDIFSDFNEDLDAARIAEDERFYRYGRFFSIIISLGTTTFTGNRGAAYNDNLPAYGLGLIYFSDFQNAFGLGLEYSQHNFDLPDEVVLNNDTVSGNGTNNGPGLVEVNMLRVYFSGRHYIDTADLGTAITYSNPYFIMRIEYWYTTNKFKDQPNLANDSGSGLGVGLGMGLEFPIKIKESYINVEALWHQVNLHDKDTQAYKATDENNIGYNDLTGNVLSLMVGYVINW